MIINGKKEKICSYLSNYHKYLNKGKLEIKLIVIKIYLILVICFLDVYH